MHFDPTASAETILEELRREAERAYGPERLGVLEPFLAQTAAALARLGEETFEPYDEEPDLLATGGPRG
jgi:hypothetical protein